jgi:hypothetical protein
MANTVQKTYIQKGASKITLHLYLESDGAAGDLTSYVVIDPVTELGMAPGRDLTFERIFFELQGFSCRFGFDGGASGEWPAWLLSAGATSPHDFTSFGDIPDRSGGADGLNATGKLLLTTNGFTSTSCRGSLVLQLKRSR